MMRIVPGRRDGSMRAERYKNLSNEELAEKLGKYERNIKRFGHSKVMSQYKSHYENLISMVEQELESRGEKEEMKMVLINDMGSAKSLIPVDQILVLGKRPEEINEVLESYPGQESGKVFDYLRERGFEVVRPVLMRVEESESGMTVPEETRVEITVSNR
jgi:cobalamin biosynthesis Co2+ chelatase CbiK